MIFPKISFQLAAFSFNLQSYIRRDVIGAIAFISPLKMNFFLKNLSVNLTLNLTPKKKSCQRNKVRFSPDPTKWQECSKVAYKLVYNQEQVIGCLMNTCSVAVLYAFCTSDLILNLLLVRTNIYISVSHFLLFTHPRNCGGVIFLIQFVCVWVSESVCQWTKFQL